MILAFVLRYLTYYELVFIYEIKVHIHFWAIFSSIIFNITIVIYIPSYLFIDICVIVYK